MKTHKTLSIDVDVAKELNKETNMSEYVEELIKEDKNL